MDGLVILLPETPDLLWFWWRIAGAEAGRALAFDPARETAPWGDPGAVTVLVPAASAPVIDKPVPAAMPLAQALTAERLSAAKAGLAGERHMALAASDGRILSCSLAAPVSATGNAHRINKYRACTATPSTNPQITIRCQQSSLIPHSP